MSDIPDDLRNLGLQTWIEALRDGTPDAGDIIARAIFSEVEAERQRNAEIMEEVRKCLEPLIGVADLEDSHYALDAVMVELDRLRAVRALLLKLGGGNG